MLLIVTNAIILQCAIALASIALAIRIMPGVAKSISSLLTYGSFLLIGLIVGIQMIAGWCDQLNLIGVSILGYAISIGALIGCGRNAWKEGRMSYGRIPILLFLILSPLAILLIIESFNALILPVWEYDSVAYHAHIIREWYVWESLRIIPFTVFAGPVGYYPSTAELLFLWPLLLLQIDAFINIPNNLLFIALIATIFHGVQRSSKRLSFLLMPLLLYTPVLWKELGSQHVDLFFLLSFVWTAFFLWEYCANGRPVFLVLTCAAGGLFLGSKYLALPFAVPLVLLFLVIMIRESRKGNVWKQVLLPLGIGVGIFVLMGGYWYIRNATQTFNPLFPATLRIGTTVIATGYTTLHDTIFNRSLLHMLPQSSWREIARMLFVFIDRIGWQSLLIGLAYAALIKDLIAKKCRSCWKRPDIGIALLCTFYFYLYIAAPNSYGDYDANIRYSILAVALGYVLVALLIKQRILSILPVGILAFFGIVVTVFRTLLRQDLPHELLDFRLIAAYPLFFALMMLGMIAGSLLFLLVWRLRHDARWNLLLVIILIPLSLFPVAPLLESIRAQEKYPSLLQKYPNVEPLLSAMQWIESNAEDAKIAYAGFSFRSPLYGATFARSVHYIPVHACEKCDYAEFRSAPRGIYQDASREEWMHEMRAQNIDYLLIHNERGYLDETMEPQWAQSLRFVFHPVFQKENVILYKVEAM